jgi:hypothetical protein
MKKLAGIIFAVSMLAFAGCETRYYSVTITNNSSKQVAYFYNGGTDILDPCPGVVSKNYQVKAYTQMPADISVVSSDILSVAIVQNRDDYIFEDIAPIDLNVVNTMPFPITIEAGNYINDGEGKTKLSVPAKSEKTGAIYTPRPKFTVSAEYPVNFVKIEWEMKGNTISVTIE